MKKQKRMLIRLLTLVCITVLLAQPALAAFSDVSSGSWYAEYVDYVEQHGLFQGTSKTEFSPNLTMTRGMFVTVLYRVALEPDVESSVSRFTDVPAGTYYTAPVLWASASGIVEGVTPTTFCPNAPVTREQMCTLIVRFCQHIGFALPEAQEAVEFADAGEISPYAVQSIALCQQAGLILGYEDGTLRPSKTATRAEVSAIIQRLGLLLEDAGYTVGPGKQEDWRLILVNRWNLIPEGYVEALTLKSIGNGYYVDARIYDDLMEMLSAMRADGTYPYITSAYRTHEYQQTLFNNKINYYISCGYSYSNAVALAQQWVAVPGTSEHELGLAVDISSNVNSSAVYSWLAANSWRYGFIYRYQADKKEITGIQPEPWHYRYVGKDNAKLIYESGLCLEEYLEQVYQYQ